MEEMFCVITTQEIIIRKKYFGFQEEIIDFGYYY